MSEVKIILISVAAYFNKQLLLEHSSVQLRHGLKYPPPTGLSIILPEPNEDEILFRMDINVLSEDSLRHKVHASLRQPPLVLIIGSAAISGIKFR